ncbi:hypothetical protein GmHk_06G016647 [Glycine max]|nr:hypothetical protein GmHk_06G016647 [Glycine max]
MSRRLTLYDTSHNNTSPNFLVRQNPPPLRILHSVFYLHSHAFRETFQKVTLPITTPSQTRLIVEFLTDGLPKSKCILLSLIPTQPLDPSYSDVICLGCYMPINFCLDHPRTTSYWERGSMIISTNQHETFYRVLSSLTRFPEKIPEGHSSHNYSKPSMLNYKNFK